MMKYFLIQSNNQGVDDVYDICGHIFLGETSHLLHLLLNYPRNASLSLRGPS